MENRTQVAHYAATMTRELCRMCRKAELDDLAYLLEVAAAEAAKAEAAPEKKVAAKLPAKKPASTPQPTIATQPPPSNQPPVAPLTPEERRHSKF